MQNKNLCFLFDILVSNKPSLLIKRYEDIVFELIPELKLCKGFNQNNEWHIYDVYSHILHVIDGVRSDLIIRLAALFHDIGKPYTYTEDEFKIGHFYGHFNESNKIFMAFAKKYNLESKLVNTTSKLIYYHDINFDSLTEDELKNILNKFNKEELQLLFELKRSDLLAQNKKYHYLLENYNNTLKKIIEIKKFKDDFTS